MKNLLKTKITTKLFVLLLGIFTTTSLFSQAQELLSKVRENDLNALKESIAAGADVNMQDDMMGFTPLILSVYSANKEMAELLLSNGADINVQEKMTGYTPLMLTLNSNKAEMAEFLLEKGADFTIKGNDGATALILACGVSPEIAKNLLQKGADIHVRTDKGLGVFSQCITMGMMRGNEKITPEFAEFLLSQGAEIDEKNTMSGYKGYTPLFWAVQSGEADIVKFLTEKGADVNAVAEGGKTSLSLASEAGHEDIVEILKNHGAK